MAKVSERFIELNREFPLRPLKTESDLDRATAVMHKLIDQKSLSSPEADYLDVLGDLIHAYEAKVYPIKPLEPHVFLSEAIESRGLTQKDVSVATGIPMSTISELLSQKREFNVTHIRKLSGYFHCSPNVFIDSRVPA